MRFLIAVFLVFTAAPATAQEAFRLCAIVKDDKDRLACFDALTRQKPEPPKSEKSASVEWNVTESRAPLDDTPQVTAILEARDGQSALVLRCAESKTEAAFAPKGYLGSTQNIKVTYRIGQTSPISASWNPSHQGRATFSPQAGAFIKALPDNETFYIRATGYGGDSKDGTFDLGRVSEVRAKIATACKWSAPAAGERPKQAGAEGERKR